MLRRILKKIPSPSNKIKIIGVAVGSVASYHYIHNRFSEKTNLPYHFGASHSISDIIKQSDK
jgi:hypothetical protein